MVDVNNSSNNTQQVEVEVRHNSQIVNVVTQHNTQQVGVESQTNKNSVEATNNLCKYYEQLAKEHCKDAKEYSELATNAASNAQSSATSAETSSDNAQVWAEGTDSEVQALGGTHSAEGWVDYVLTNPPTATVTRHSNYATVKTTYVDDGEEVESEANIYDGSGAVDDVKVNGTSVLSDKVANVTVPTKTSDLENDENFVKSSEMPTNLSDFTDDLGSNPTHTHSQYIEEVKTINSESITGSGNLDLDSKYVNVTGDTMSGSLTVSPEGEGNIVISPNGDSIIEYTNKNFKLSDYYSTAPTSSIVTGGQYYYDNTGERTMFSEQLLKSDNRLVNSMVTRRVFSDGTSKLCGFWCGIDADGSKYYNPVQLITTYVNGTSWYRVWSDGWIEQGGRLTVAAQATTYTVSLLKSFADTNYSIVMQPIINADWDPTNNQAPKIKVLSKNQYTVRSACTADRSNYYYSWFACGY